MSLAFVVDPVAVAASVASGMSTVSADVVAAAVPVMVVAIGDSVHVLPAALMSTS